VRLPLISADDHVIEAPDMFVGRLPAALAEMAPRVVELADGAQGWLYEGAVMPSPGLNAVAGRPVNEWRYEPTRFDEMRPGCYQVDARVHDMDLAGVWASVSFPSYLAGFGGANFSRSKDHDLGLACVRAWNQWHHEDFALRAPERVIPLQISWLHDPVLSADDVRNNAELGFKALSFPEIPHELGLPSIHTDHWDPLLRPCEETGTVVCLHTGSSGIFHGRGQGAPLEESVSLFQVHAQVCAADWLWSGVCTRFPELRIVLAEGGIGWVPMYLDRLDYMTPRSLKAFGGWPDPELTPAEMLQRSFWFCTLDDPSTIGLVDRIGVDHVMVEVDYPHSDSTWPDSQDVACRLLQGLPAATMRKLAYENAAALFRHPLPPPGWNPLGAA